MTDRRDKGSDNVELVVLQPHEKQEIGKITQVLDYISYFLNGSDWLCLDLGFPPQDITLLNRGVIYFFGFFFLNPDSANNGRLLSSRRVLPITERSRKPQPLETRERDPVYPEQNPCS